LYEVGNKQWNIPKLKELLEDIIPRNSQVSDFEVTHLFPSIGEKVMILNARRLVRKMHKEHLILLAIEDITQHRKAQRLIAEREEWFRGMADRSPMMLWVTDNKNKMQFVNKAFLEFRELRLDEVIGRDWIEEMEPKKEKKIKKIMEEAFHKKKEFTVQYSVANGSKTVRVMSRGNPNYSPEGEFVGYIGICVELPG